MTGRGLRAAPSEVRLVAAMLLGGALVFDVETAVRAASEGAQGLLGPPIVLTVLAVLGAAWLLLAVRFAWYVTIIVFTIVGLTHLAIAVYGGPWWTRVISGLVVAMQVFGGIMANTGPSRRYLDGSA